MTFKIIAKYATLAGLVGATLIGSYSSHKDDCPPFYTNKIGTSGGICISFISSIDKEAKFYGINISIVNLNEGTINGAVVSIANCPNRVNGKVNGLEVGLGNVPQKNNAFSEEVNGLQIGVLNVAKNSGRALQIGGYNEVRDSTNGFVRRGLGINYANGAAQK